MEESLYIQGKRGISKNIILLKTGVLILSVRWGKGTFIDHFQSTRSFQMCFLMNSLPIVRKILKVLKIRRRQQQSPSSVSACLDSFLLIHFFFNFYLKFFLIVMSSQVCKIKWFNNAYSDDQLQFNSLKGSHFQAFSFTF